MSAVECVDLYVIARLEDECAVADLYSCETYYDITDGHPVGPLVQGWLETLSTPADADVCLGALDLALTTSGYTRTSEWSRRSTAAGAVRFFTDAVACIEDIEK
ncbi:hypothetical protein AB0M22_44965 [Nocardia sp. NPDC051756]|uniref:hypothetical protein n=1 Tax=Nocardia sp. NPDC051756 TaxID=3154751 RepID=UPI0034139024